MLSWHVGKKCTKFVSKKNDKMEETMEAFLISIYFYRLRKISVSSEKELTDPVMLLFI